MHDDWNTDTRKIMYVQVEDTTYSHYDSEFERFVRNGEYAHIPWLRITTPHAIVEVNLNKIVSITYFK